MIQQLQGFRFLLISGIFLHHTYWFLNPNTELTPVWIINLGIICVTGFFMLSGFLYGYKLWGGQVVPILARTEYEVPYYVKAWRKIKKLYPLHLAMLIFAFFAKFPHNLFELLRDLMCLPFNLTLTQSFVPHIYVANSFNGPSWFLSALFGIYLCLFYFPRFNFIFAKYNAMRLLIGLIVIQILYLLVVDNLPYYIIPIKKEVYYSWLTYYNPLINLSIFISGMIVARIWNDILNKNLCSNFMLVISVSSICLFAQSPNKSEYLFVPIELSFVLFLLSILSEKNIVSRVMSLPLFVFLGNLSAYIFLIHGTINYLLRAYCMSYFSSPYLFFISLCLTLVLSYFYKILVDEKVIKL